MSSLNNVAPNSEVGKAILILAAYYDAAKDAEKRLAGQQVMRSTPMTR
jgi:hypothetical protein